MDESNIGNRDDALRKTYRGLVNLRHVLLILSYSYLLLIFVAQEGLYAILVLSFSDVAMLHWNRVGLPYNKQRVCGTFTCSL